ncbi:MAG: hypothetical protein Fur0026_10230 [Sideroxydans sp.]
MSQGDRPFVPTEVHVVTTTEGAHRIRLQLLDQTKGKFHEFCRDYGLTGQIAFPPENVKILTDLSGRPLQDIVSPEDNENAADQIVAWLRSFTQDPECAIHACLAGGRKTMGFYLGYGLSLYGREQDRLSHVLVSPEFEGHREFFYKPPTSQTLYARSMVGALVDERPVSTEDARIWLAEIPFVRLRDGMPSELLAGKASYTDAVLAVQQSLPNNRLKIDIPNRHLTCGGIEVKLPPREFAFYTWHVQRSLRFGSQGWISWKDTLGENNPLMEEYFAIYLSILGNDKMHPDYETARKAFVQGFGKDDWASMLHHVREAIRNTLNKRHGANFLIQSRKVERSGRLMRYGIDYPAERIEIV